MGSPATAIDCASSSTRPWELCGSGSIAEVSAAASHGRLSTTYWITPACRGHGFLAGAVLDYSAGFSMHESDADTSISEEPGAKKRHAGICAGAVRATGRPTAMPDTTDRRCGDLR